MTSPLTSMAGATAYELQLAQLLQDRLRLKQVQSTQGKAELKAQLLPAYLPYVQGVLQAGQGAQDEVLTTIMVWRIDASDFAGALDIAAYVLRHKMIMPDRFERTTGCLIAEEIAETALKVQKAGGTFDLDVLLYTEQVTAGEDMPDQARAKLHLALGKAYASTVSDDESVQLLLVILGHLEAAKMNLCRAIELNSNCGGKKDLERVERLLKKHTAPGS